MQVGAAQKEVREGTIGDDQAVARHADAPLDREEAVAQHAPLSTPRPRPEPHDHLVSWSRERRASVGRSVGGEREWDPENGLGVQRATPTEGKVSAHSRGL
jgi:hypothetical protein